MDICDIDNIINLLKASLAGDKYQGNLNDSCIDLVAKHGIASYVANVLETTPEKLRLLKERDQYSNLLMKRELINICKVLNGEKIEPIVLKGFSYLEKYPYLNSRSFTDIDLQVEPNYIESVHRKLINLGYQMVEGKNVLDPDVTFQKGRDSYHLNPYVKGKITIELHQNFDSIIDVNIPEMIRSAVPLDLGPCKIKQYSEIDCLIYACLHYIRHGYDLKGIFTHRLTLKHVLDVCILFQYIIKKGFTYKDLFSRAKDLNAEKWVFHVLLRIRNLVPNHIADDLLEDYSIKYIGHDVDWEYRDINITFFERLLMPDKSLSKLTQYMEQHSLLTECMHISNLNKDNKPIVIDERNANNAHPYLSQICEFEGNTDLRSLSANTAWDHDNFYFDALIKTEVPTELPFDELVIIFSPNNLDELKPIDELPKNQIVLRLYPKTDFSIENNAISYGYWTKRDQKHFQVFIKLPFQNIGFVPYANRIIRFDTLIKYNKNKNVLIWNGKPTYGKLTFVN